jgi:HK97 family phage portal protein
MRWWPFGRRRELRQQMTLEQLLAESAPPTWAGVPVNADSAQRLSTVWACVRLLSDTVSTLPVDTYRRGDRTPLEPPAVLVTPAAGWDLSGWLEANVRSLLLRGNSYSLVVDRGADLRPSQVEPVHPDAMGVRITAEGMVEYRFRGKPWPAEDVLHIKAYRMGGLPVGLSPVEYARQGIGLALAAEEYGARLFGMGSLMGGVLQTDAELDENEAKALKDRWREKVAGLAKAHDIIVLDSGAKYVPISIPPDQAQFLESRKFQVAEIARIFGVPPEMVAAEAGNSLTYANVEQRSIDFLTYGLRPWLTRLEHALGSLLPRGQYCKFNAAGLLRTDLKTRYQSYKLALEGGWLTLDEVRELEDREPLRRAA